MRRVSACTLTHEWVEREGNDMLRVACSGPATQLARMPHLAAAYARKQAAPRGLRVSRITSGATLGPERCEYRVTYVTHAPEGK